VNLFKRVKGVVFLGTPQRGANDAVLLKRLLSALPNASPRYVDDLGKDSSVISDINYAFPSLALEGHLLLAAYYETNPFEFIGVTLWC